MYDYDVLSIPFLGGLDTKSDEKTVMPGKLLTLENGEFIEGKSIGKRFGYSSVPAEDAGGTTLVGSVKALAPTQNTVSVLTDQKAYSYSVKEGAWADQGMFSCLSYSKKEVAQTNAEQTYAEAATANGVTCCVWEDSRGGVRCAVYDEVTGAYYDADKVLDSSNAARPRVVAIGGVLIVTWVDTGNNNIDYLRIKSWDVDGSLSVAAATLVSDLSGTTNAYDVVEVNDQYAVLAYDTSNAVVTGARACHLTAGGAVDTYVTINSSNVNTCISAFYYEPAGQVFIAYDYSATQARLTRHTASDMTTELSTFYAFTGTLYNLTIHVVEDQVSLWITKTGGSNDLYTVMLVEMTHDYSSTNTETIQHSFLAGGGFVHNDVGYVVLGHDSRSGIQNAYYFFTHTGKMVGQALIGEGAGIIDSKDHLPKPRECSTTGDFLFPLSFTRLADAEGDGIAVFEHKGIQLLTIEGDATPSYAELGRTTHASGAQLWTLAGGQPVESGFHMFPDVMDADISHNGNASSNIAANVTYNYRFYYEFRLPNGERMRSGAITRTITTTLAQEIDIDVPTLAYTLKDSGLNGVTDVSIVGYRTEANKSTLYHRITDVDPTATGDNGYYANDVTAAAVTITDDMADSTLITKELDLRSAGEVNHFSAPAPSTITTIGGRLFMAGGELDDDEVAFSLFHVTGKAAAFTNSFVVDGIAGRGPVQAVHSINGVPVVFKERSIYVLDGIGPDNTNSGGYYQASRVTADVGLRDKSAVVETPDGLMFVSHKGIYLLDQQFNVSYVGAEVEDYNAQTFTAAHVIPNSNSVVFLTSSGKTLLYDYYYREWGTWTNHEGLSAAVYQGSTYTYLRNNGEVYFRSEEYTDAGVPYSMRLRCAPIRPEFLQGWWYLRAFQVLGDYRSPHKLKVSVYYDRETAPAETYTWDPSTVISTDYWGDNATWGAGSYWGGTAGGKDYQHEHAPKRNLCQSVSLEFEDVPGTNPGASFELTELAILYRPWSGTSRLPATRNY